jgi:hypothetical protein
MLLMTTTTYWHHSVDWQIEAMPPTQPSEAGPGQRDWRDLRPRPIRHWSHQAQPQPQMLDPTQGETSPRRHPLQLGSPTLSPSPNPAPIGRCRRRPPLLLLLPSVMTATPGDRISHESPAQTASGRPVPAPPLLHRPTGSGPAPPSGPRWDCPRRWTGRDEESCCGGWYWNAMPRTTRGIEARYVPPLARSWRRRCPAEAGPAPCCRCRRRRHHLPASRRRTGRRRATAERRRMRRRARHVALLIRAGWRPPATGRRALPACFRRRQSEAPASAT